MTGADAMPSPSLPSRAWRASYGPMPAGVMASLILSCREDLGAAWHRVARAEDAASGDRRWAYSARAYLVDQGLTTNEADAVVRWMWPTRS